MAFRPSDVIGLIWHHPIVSLFVVLLFTPPLFPIVVYFSPLLISTALFVLAMISMESDHANDPHPYGTDIPYSKRVWIEEVELDGPILDGERVPKRLKASSNDEGWLDKVKNWEGTGWAWVESVLSQEARHSSDSNASSRDDSFPLLDKARGFFVEDVRKRSRDDEPISSKPPDGVKATGPANDPAPSVHEEKPKIVGNPPRPLGADSGQSSRKIIPDLESEDELIELAPANIPPSPLFRNKSLPKTDKTVDTSSDFLKKAEDSRSDARSNVVESAGGSVPHTGPEDRYKSATGTDSVNKDIIPLVVDQNVDERATADVENSSNCGEIATPSNVSVGMESNSITQETVAKETNPVVKETAPSSGGQVMPEIKALSSGVHRNPAEDSEANVTTEGDRGKPVFQHKEAKSSAELLGPFRQGQASYGLGTPSAAVALSEKLKVPLADIMSLLAGDGKENAPNEGPSGVEVSSSSETTTSQEEEWSASDVESSAAPIRERGLASFEKDP